MAVLRWCWDGAHERPGNPSSSYAPPPLPRSVVPLPRSSKTERGDGTQAEKHTQTRTPPPHCPCCQTGGSPASQRGQRAGASALLPPARGGPSLPPSPERAPGHPHTRQGHKTRQRHARTVSVLTKICMVGLAWCGLVAWVPWWSVLRARAFTEKW